MKPFVLEADKDKLFNPWEGHTFAEDFSTGLGAVSDAFNVEVHEVLNGEYTCSFSVPRTSRFFEILNPEMIIKIKVRQSDRVYKNDDSEGLYDLFVITKIDIKSNPDIATVTAKQYTMLYSNVIHSGNIVFNEYTNYDSPLRMIYSMNFSSIGESLKDKIEPLVLLADTLGIGGGTYPLPKVDISGITMNTPNLNTFLYGDKDSLANLTNMRLMRRLNVIYALPMNSDFKFDIRRGKNIKGISISRNIDNLTTEIVPYCSAENSDDTPIYGKHVKSKLADNYTFPHITAVDFSSRAKNLDDLNRIAEKYFDENKDIDKPTYSIEIDVLTYGEDADSVELGDIGVVHDSVFNLDVELPVTERTYDPVLERTTSLKLGTPTENPFNKIQKKINQIEKKIG